MVTRRQTDAARIGAGIHQLVAKHGEQLGDLRRPLHPVGRTFHAQDAYELAFGQLSASGVTAQIYVGHIRGLDGALPDTNELSDDGIINEFPQW